MTIRSLQNVYVVAPDMDQAAAFYGEALGLELKFRDGDRWTQFRLGAGNFSLASPAEAGAGAVGAVPVFEVDDLDAAVARVTDGGGNVAERRDMGAHGRSANCADPAGNRFQLFQRA
jgi:predicted enzyme related to lactoylglutathione lyase